MTTEALKELEANLWAAATKLRSDSDLKLNEFATPVLGLIFLKFADNKYTAVEEDIQAELTAQQNSRRQRPEHEIAIEKCGFYLPTQARYDYLLRLPEQEDIAKAIKEAMSQIEHYKPELQDTLPKDEYDTLTRTDPHLPRSLLRNFKDIPADASGDIFGKIYEYFLGEFALAEGQGGGEFFTPTSVVKYMVEVIEPYKGTIFDPACGSGGMFVQSSYFVDRRKQELHDDDTKDLFAYGCEKTQDTVKLAKMNLVVNGLRGDIKQSNSYYEDEHESFGKFDYVMANPPFNVKEVNYHKVKDDRRFNAYGIPKNKGKSKKDGELVPNANYLWINLFATSLKPRGRAALVMANSASDARHSEKDIRETLIKRGLIAQMVSLTSNMFNTVTLPASLWFFDKGHEIQDFDAEKDNIQVLFVDARNVYRQIDRAHRDFTDEQVWNLATITRLHRGENQRFTELVHRYLLQMQQHLPPVQEQEAAFVSALNALGQQLHDWLAQAELTEAQQQLVQEKAVISELKALRMATSPTFQTAYETTIQALEQYIAWTEAAPEPVDYAAHNQRQRTVAEGAATLRQETKKRRATLEKAYRSLENLHKLADKELRAKNDTHWKTLASLRELRRALDNWLEYTHEQINNSPQHVDKSALYYLRQVQWLQERFPDAQYEDVTGLCKVAGIDEIAEQDYSLNPGRYVGVVIEEDGMTEEEFQKELMNLNHNFQILNREALTLQNIINRDIKEILLNEAE